MEILNKTPHKSCFTAPIIRVRTLRPRSHSPALRGEQPFQDDSILVNHPAVVEVLIRGRCASQ
jgi:hypothetical protein